MPLQVFLIFFLQALFTETQANTLTEVSAYVGDNITLPSGADPSWALSKVDWSIYRNTTWIATYDKSGTRTEQFYKYKGRLSLCSHSGNLTIHNLKADDAMVYSVDLISEDGKDSVNMVRLIVRQHLQKPTIESVSRSVKGGCWVVLNCSSNDEGVEFTWQVNPPRATVLNMTTLNRNPAVLFAILNITQGPVKFTCTSRRSMESSSSVFTPTCDAEKPQPRPQPCPQSRCTPSVFFLLGFVVGLILTVLFFFREKIKDAWKCFIGKLCPSTSST